MIKSPAVVAGLVVATLALITLALITIVGWGMNIADIAGHVGDFTGLLILRIVGIFVVPLGAFLGLFI